MYNYCLAFKNTGILDTESNLTKRLFKEMMHISKNKNKGDKRADIDNLSQICYYFN